VITVSTTSDDEAQFMAGLLSGAPSGLNYRIYLRGREFTARLPRPRLPDFGLPHPANQPDPAGGHI
jgi:hypothetical protein